MESGRVQPIGAQASALQNVKLLGTTRQNSPEDPIFATFLVTDENGVEIHETAQIPSAVDLYGLCQENRWFTKGAAGVMRRYARTA